MMDAQELLNLSPSDYQNDKTLTADSVAQSMSTGGTDVNTAKEWFKTHGGITDNAQAAIDKYYSSAQPTTQPETQPTVQPEASAGPATQTNTIPMSVPDTSKNIGNPTQDEGGTIAERKDTKADRAINVAQQATVPMGDLTQAERISNELGSKVGNINPEYIKSLPKFLLQAYKQGEFGEPSSTDAKARLGYFIINNLGTALTNASATIKGGPQTQSQWQQIQNTNLQQGLQRHNKLISDRVDNQIKILSTDATQQQNDRNELNKLYRDRVFKNYADMMNDDEVAYVFQTYKNIGKDIQGMNDSTKLALIQGMMMVKGGDLKSGGAALLTVFGPEVVQKIGTALGVDLGLTGNPTGDTNGPIGDTIGTKIVRSAQNKIGVAGSNADAAQISSLMQNKPEGSKISITPDILNSVAGMNQNSTGLAKEYSELNKEIKAANGDKTKLSALQSRVDFYNQVFNLAKKWILPIGIGNIKIRSTKDIVLDSRLDNYNKVK
jgi:hypothetical protein